MGKKWRTRKIRNKNKNKNKNKSKSGKRSKTMRKKYIQKGGVSPENDYKVFIVNPNNVFNDKIAYKDVFDNNETLFAPSNDENPLSNDDIKKFYYFMRCIKSRYSRYFDPSTNLKYKNDYKQLKNIINGNYQMENKILLFVSKNEDKQIDPHNDNYLGCAIYNSDDKTSVKIIKPELENDTTQVTDNDNTISKIDKFNKLIEIEIEKMQNNKNSNDMQLEYAASVVTTPNELGAASELSETNTVKSSGNINSINSIHAIDNEFVDKQNKVALSEKYLQDILLSLK